MCTSLTKITISQYVGLERHFYFRVMLTVLWQREFDIIFKGNTISRQHQADFHRNISAKIQGRSQAIVHSRWEDLKKNLNNFAI